MLNKLLKLLLTAPIRAYKFFLSPWVGQSCRFTPTCSSYAIEAIETLGPARGLLLSARRIGRCHPWCAGGDDPVPVSTRSEVPEPIAPSLQNKNHTLSSRCHTD